MDAAGPALQGPACPALSNGLRPLGGAVTPDTLSLQPCPAQRCWSPSRGNPVPSSCYLQAAEQHLRLGDAFLPSPSLTLKEPREAS